MLTVIYVFYNKCDVLALVYANTEFLANSLSYLYRACVLRWLKRVFNCFNPFETRNGYEKVFVTISRQTMHLLTPLLTGNILRLIVMS